MVTTDQTVEGTNIVSIGYHYVAVDGNGNPISTLVSGVPDYISDASGNGLPDGWETNYFGNLNHFASELDSSGNTLLSDYQNDRDPNVIAFSIEVTNNYVNSSSPTLNLNVTFGTPSYYAVLTDNTNFMAANWIAFTSSNLTASLGSIEGWHELWVGLKGCAPEATQTWVWKRLKLDFTPPQLVITNPASSTVDVPMIQIYGYCPEPLDHISYDLTNALGLVTNLDAGLASQDYDTDTGDFTTNYFECLDVPLTNGLNVITIHAADLAGNVTATNFSYVVDYSSKTPPVAQLTWPQDGMKICGSSVTLRGQVDDPTVTVTATITDASGNSNTVAGEVERDGRFWVEDLPLSSGTDGVSIIFSNIVSQSTVTNLNLVQSPLTLTIDPVADDSQLWQPTVSLSGTVSDPSYAVWVNGVPGINDGNGTWNADSVPTTPGGVAIFDVTAYPPAEAPASDAGGNGVNPQTLNAVNATADPDKPARCYLAHYSEDDGGDAEADLVNYWGLCTSTFNWSAANSGHWDDGGGGGGSSRFNVQYGNDDCNGGFLNYTFSETMNNPASAWPDIALGTSSYTIDEEWGNPFGQSTSSGTDGWVPPIVWEHCQVKLPVDINAGWPYQWLGSWFVPSSATTGNYHRKADVTIKLQTGGKGTSRRQNLFEISGGVSEVLDNHACAMSDNHGGFMIGGPYEYGYSAPTRPIPMQEVMIDGMPLGDDGKQWRAYADNDTRDLTPRVTNKDFYTFDVGAAKYHPYIDVGGHNLDIETPEFCVGENVAFTLQGLPDFVDVVGHWDLPDKFVNEQYPYSSVCTSYRRNNDLLTITGPQNPPMTTCWFVNGTGGRVGVNANLHFSNGQYASVAAQGNISIYRPTVTQFTSFPPFTPMISDYQCNAGIPVIGLGNHCSGAGYMDFRAVVKSKSPYLGDVGWTQLANRAVSDCQSCGTYGQYWLDNAEFPYGTVHFDDLVTETATNRFSDGPDIIFRPNVSIADNFKTYLRFHPPGAGIWITLGVVNWGWSATVQDYVLTSKSVTGPSDPDGSDEFPLWPNIIHNFP